MSTRTISAAIKNTEQAMSKARACASVGDDDGAIAMLAAARRLARAIERNGHTAPDTNI